MLPKSEKFLLPSAVSQSIAAEVKRSKLEFANMAPISSIHIAFSRTEIWRNNYVGSLFSDYFFDFISQQIKIDCYTGQDLS